MKYIFKSDLAFRELDHKLRRLINENGLSKYKIILPITTDPTTYVAAHILNKIIPESCTYIYFKDNIYHNDFMDSIVNDLSKSFKDKFEIIDAMNECKEYLLYLNEINTIENTLMRLKMQIDAKYMWLLTNYVETPILINGLNNICVKYNIGTLGYSINLFTNLQHGEIMNIGIDRFKLSKDLLDNMTNNSGEVSLIKSYFDYDNNYIKKYRMNSLLENLDMHKGYDTNRNIYLSMSIFYGN